VPGPGDLVVVPKKIDPASARTDPVSRQLRKPHRMLTPLEP
jgi:hypothetical protein